MQVNIKKAKRYEDKKTNKHGMQQLLSKNKAREAFDWSACVWTNLMCTQESKRKVGQLTENLSFSQNIHHLSFFTDIHARHGGKKGKICCEILPLFGLISPPTRSLYTTKISISRGGEGDDYFHFWGQKPALSDSAPSSIGTSTLLAPGFLLFLLFLFHCVAPTTR